MIEYFKIIILSNIESRKIMKLICVLPQTKDSYYSYKLI